MLQSLLHAIQILAGEQKSMKEATDETQGGQRPQPEF